MSLRLQDTGNVYYKLTEVYARIIDALRMLQALTGFYRERVVFNTVAGTAFYDLRALFPNEYSFTITDDALVTDIERHLIEPQTNPWTGTAQFSIPDIAEALQTVRDDFQLSTGVYATRPTPIAVGPGTQRVSLDQSVIDIRRSAWKDTASGFTYPMVRTDEYAANAYNRSWPTTFGRPYAYSIAVSPPVTVQLIPPNLLAGSLDQCVIPSGPTLACNPGSPALIGIPDDLAWGVEWGALSRLLAHDSSAKDTPRSQIADELHRLAMSVAKLALSAVNVEVHGATIGVESLDDLDRYQASWQQLTPAKPNTAAFVSANLFALSPIPDGIYTVEIDLARSFPIPDVLNPGTTYLQVGYELVDPVLDMAQWLATFKEGTSDLQAAMPCRQRFLERCGYLNERLRANATYDELLKQPAQKQQIQVPRVMEPETQETPANA